MPLNYQFVILLLRTVFFLLISYGLLYFSYKYFSPDFGQSDFYHYYKMALEPLNFTVTESPFIYRQFSTVMTALVYETGLFYNIKISYVHEGIEQQLFFAFIVSNYLALLLTSVVVSKVVDLEIGKVTVLAPLFTGTLCYLSFGASTYVLTGLVEGWSWFLIALAYYAFKKENLYLFIVVLMISLFQKEVVSMIFGVISAVYILLAYFDRKKQIDKKYVWFFMISIGTFFTYILIRKVLIPVGGFENQLDFNQLLHYLITYDFFDPRKLYITVFSQNLFYLVLLLFGLNFFLSKNEKNRFHLLRTNFIIALITVCIVLFFIGMAAALGSNIGRIVLTTSPLSAIYIGYYLYLLERRSQVEKNV
ncbi:MAG TPA: hypothetical protein ENK66_10550 [Arcobacter sp.]|nr:hypothetical protein [Arcobacter sp.]